MRIFIFSFLLMLSCNLSGQHIISGDVYNAKGFPLGGSIIVLDSQVFESDSKGKFKSAPINSGDYKLQVSFIGYKTLDTIIHISSNKTLHLHLGEDSTLLENVLVKVSEKSVIYNVERVLQEDLIENYSGSFAKTLEIIPGVNSVGIGSGSSKPIIRGLGFNRVAVAENGIKQEGQQWGADHGLEIDGLNTEEVDVIKGVGTIEYGSDAIGGVIQINNEKLPAIHSFSGSATLLGKTANEAFGASVNIKSRKDHFFYKLKLTRQEYGDYRVPTSEIYYLNTNIPIYNGRMKNTAGKEFDFYVQLGYVDKNIQNILSISNVYNKSGFFPGSHGIPSIEAVKDDGDSRNIDFPNQNVNHFKINNNTLFKLSEVDQLKITLAFQNNKRQESSYFHSHYGEIEEPKVNPNLELEFVLNNIDLSAKYEHLYEDNHKTTIGIQHNYQNNNIGGYGFLLPKFNRASISVFGMHEYEFSDVFKIQAGARGDYANVDIKSFFDNILNDFLINNGYSKSVAEENAARSVDLNRNFYSFNAMVGGTYELSNLWDIGATVGTNFRFPTAIELAANGLHHGAFRHEKGDPNLKPEKGLALDLHIDFNKDDFKSSLSPYVYYFNNYIFLKPSGTFSILPDGGQVYQYTQSKAILTGVDWKIEKTFWDNLKVDAVFEFLYNQQFTGNAKRNFPLPFSTPLNLFAQIDYKFKDYKFLKDNHININGKWYAKQKRIAQGEDISPSYELFGIGLSTEVNIGNFIANVYLTGTNLLNTKALNHTSYYRPIQIPELGRSFQLMVKIPF